MLSSEHTQQYLELRKRGMIGKLFCDSGAFRLAPVDALPGLEHSISDPISLDNLVKLLDNLSLLMLRLSPQFELLAKNTRAVNL